jgi:phosphate/sulfate permease
MIQEMFARALTKKTLILAAFAALSLIAAIAPVTSAAIFGVPQSTSHSGPYDNTGSGPGQTGLEGGGG